MSDDPYGLRCPNCNSDRYYYKFINGKEIFLCSNCGAWQPTTLEYYLDLIKGN